MNNVAITEFGALANAPDKERYAERYEKVFAYYVDHATWSVDFDRDGLIAPAGMQVKAFANSGPGLQTEGVRHRRNLLLDTGNTSTHGAALARHNSRILLLTPTSAGLVMQSAPDTLNGCVQAGGEDGSNPCTSFTGTSVLTAQAVTSVDAATIGGRVQVVFLDTAGALKSATLTVSLSGVGTFSIGTTIATGVIGEPALIATAVDTGLLVFKKAGNVLYESRRGSNGLWSIPAAAQGPSGENIIVSDAPGLGIGSLPGDGATFTYLHANQSINGAMLMRRNDVLNRWNTTSFPTSDSLTRPSLAYVPGAVIATQGRMYAMTTDGSGAPQIRSSAFHLVNGVNVSDFNLQGAYDNNDLKSFGVDLMFDRNVDTNLRAVVTVNLPGHTDFQHPVFEPLADGIVDRLYGSFNDWQQIGLGSCRTVSNPGGLVAHPIACK